MVQEKYQNPIRVARTKQGLSQKDLANKLGVATRTVIRWELRRSKPHPKHVWGLCRVLKKTAEELGLSRSDSVETMTCKYCGTIVLKKGITQNVQ